MTILLRVFLILFGLHLLVVTGWQFVHDGGKPASKWIAFISSRTAHLDRQVYQMRVDGHLVEQLTFNGDPEHTRMHPAWSPDGSKIAFTNYGGITRISLIEKSNIQTVFNLINDTPEFRHSMPSWSPDGTQIALHIRDQRDTEIYIMNLENGSRVQLTNSSGNNTEASWSPDGQWIAFSSERNGRFEIYRIRSDGSDEQRLTDSRGENRYPTWSGDGQWIAFASDRVDGIMQIYRMQADGSNVQQLTHLPAASTSPAWSPDGNWIAFVSETTGSPEIYRMRPDGSQIMVLTESPGENYFPTWSPTDKKRWHEGILVVVSSMCFLVAGFSKNEVFDPFYKFYS